jgi:hypothetical protein
VRLAEVSNTHQQISTSFLPNFPADDQANGKRVTA